KKVGGEGNPAAAEAGPGATSPSSAPSPSPPEPERRRTTARRRRSVNQVRRALFRFVTDGPAWRLQSGYLLRTARRALRRAGVRAELSVGHPDPAKLGRFAGYWYAAAPFLPARRATMA